MGKTLVIVESPAKIKTLEKFLGSGYIFESSVGHIRDLPEKEFGIDLEGDLEPQYCPLAGKQDVIRKLIKAAKECDQVFLCPDPDREGEAIAWHISQLLPKGTKFKRAVFNSITKDAVVKALEQPTDIDQNLVDAQQARRVLDRIVGYKISPMLNRRLQRGRTHSVSAGRVQSVALKLVVEREKEIEAFNPVEYWQMKVDLKTEEGDSAVFEAMLYSIEGKKVEKELIEGKEVALISNEETAGLLKVRLENGVFHVEKVTKKEKKRNPVPPFITSTLQQEASRHYRFSASRTMSIAQTLYEGVEMGQNGTEGLITYMRTDSVRTAPEGLAAVRDWIKTTYGEEYLTPQIKEYTTKKKAQDAHEAIRPTNLENTPEEVKGDLTEDQYKLYVLIWKRFIASQMSSAIYDTVSVDILTEDQLFLRATGSVLKFDGFLKVYEEHTDDGSEDGDRKFLPSLEDEQSLEKVDVKADQSFTRPPPRFTEASLVKELEKSGIGRPSTYAAIMNKIQSRDYTVKENNRLKPTELGSVIALMLESSFEMIMAIEFTSKMEDELEEIALGNRKWKTLIKDFWQQFSPLVDEAENSMFVPKVDTEIPCPKCKEKNLQKIWSKAKYFYGCAGYPECDFRISIEEMEFDKNQYAENFDWEQSCPKCQSDMLIRHGRYGPFLGCGKYPDCNGIVNIPKKGEEAVLSQEMPPCPAIGCDGDIGVRRSRFGKLFYSCSNFPDCDVIANSLDQLKTKYQEHSKTAYKKKEKKGTKASKAAKGKKTKKKKASGKKREMPASLLSEELAIIVGASEMSRPQVVKKVWEYIKAKDLQDPKDKRQILPDKALGDVLGTLDSVNMFKMTKLISPHIKKKS